MQNKKEPSVRPPVPKPTAIQLLAKLLPVGQRFGFENSFVQEVLSINNLTYDVSTRILVSIEYKDLLKEKQEIVWAHYRDNIWQWQYFLKMYLWDTSSYTGILFERVNRRIVASKNGVAETTP